MMDFLNDVQRWIKNDGLLYIKGMGIKKGQTIVDFGCNAGHYTIPAARVAGPHGKVYAIDREQTAVDQLMKSAQAEAPGNIIPVELTGVINSQYPHIERVTIGDKILYRGKYPVTDISPVRNFICCTENAEIVRVVIF